MLTSSPITSHSCAPGSSAKRARLAARGASRRQQAPSTRPPSSPHQRPTGPCMHRSQPCRPPTAKYPAPTPTRPRHN
eukprot:4033269-Pleurochrysis_carterae.AAC.3